MNNYLFFDSASTTQCCEEAIRLVQKYAVEDFGNPSSTHVFGQRAAKAIRSARTYFADLFRVQPEQVIFTGSGTEANNLAIYGIATAALERSRGKPIRVLASAIEHSAVRKPVESLKLFGIESGFVPVDSSGQLIEEQLIEFLADSSKTTALLSIQQVNPLIGAVLPVEEIAARAKSRMPNLIFHTDAVQAFGKIDVPQSPSSVDLVTLSGHKIGGPKGIGALIVLNKKLLTSGFRPLIWGGDQEGGLRAGTQSAGLIAGFHMAAEKRLGQRLENGEKVQGLRTFFQELLLARGLLQEARTSDDGNPRAKPKIVWNSPREALPYIISLSLPGYPAAPLAKLLEERGCLISVGSACHSRKTDLDPALTALGFPPEIQRSTLRVSLSADLRRQDIETLVKAFEDSIQRMDQLYGK